MENVNFTDSSSAKTGNITTDQNDVVMLESGKLTATGIKVTGNKSECDGIFVSGGEAVINDCTITAISSTVQNSGGKITINGGTYTSSNNALKVNKDSTITINGGKFEGDLFIGDKSTTNTTIDKAFLPGSGYKLVITEKSEDGTKVVKAEVVKEDAQVATPTPTKPGTATPTKKPDSGKQPNTGDTTGIIALVFIALSAMVVVKKKIEA